MGHILFKLFRIETCIKSFCSIKETMTEKRVSENGDIESPSKRAKLATDGPLEDYCSKEILSLMSKVNIIVEKLV